MPRSSRVPASYLLGTSGCAFLTFRGIGFAGPILCDKMLEYMIQRLDGISLGTVVIKSNDIFYAITRPYVSHSFINRVFA